MHRDTTCQRCATLTQREYDDTPVRQESQSFYKSKAWRTLRDAYISEHPLCVRCLAYGRLRTGKIVDHKRPRSERPELELEWGNLQTLCHGCHNTKTAEDTRGRGGVDL